MVYGRGILGSQHQLGEEEHKMMRVGPLTAGGIPRPSVARPSIRVGECLRIEGRVDRVIGFPPFNPHRPGVVVGMLAVR